MILKKLILKNFKSHKNTIINFKKGITIIVGENGAGKSSILEGITYALFKKAQLNQSNLIRLDNSNNIANMSVELFFERNGTEYKINRTVTSSKSTSRIFKKVNGKYILYVEGNSQVNDEVKTIIDMDIDLFLNAIYIRQGEIADLIYKKPSERKKIIGKFLQIEELEKMWENMPKIINVYKIKQEKFKGMIISEDDTKYELEENIKDKKELKIKLAECENIKNRINIQKQKISKEKNEIEMQKTNYLTLLNNIGNEKIKINKLKNEENELETAYQNILKNEKKCKKLEKLINDFEEDDIENKIIDLKSDNKFLTNDNRSINENISNIESIKEKCPICKSVIKESDKIKMINYYHKTIEKNDEKIIKNKNELDKLEDTFERQKRIKREYLELKADIKNKNSILKNIENIKTRLKRKEDLLNELNSNLEESKYDNKKLTKMKNMLDELEEENIKNSEIIGITKGKISNISSQIEKLETDLENFTMVKKEISTMDSYINLLQELRFLYGKDGLQNELRNISKYLIQKNTNDFFDRFNFNYSDLLIDEDFNVSLVQNNQEVNVNMLSGGEKMAVALALRLGITQTISGGNINCMFLDEPTIHLDGVRVNELNGLLLNLNFIPQMFIVTHNPKLENLADNVIRINKTNGISEVVK